MNFTNGCTTLWCYINNFLEILFGKDMMSFWTVLSFATVFELAIFLMRPLWRGERFAIYDKKLVVAAIVLVAMAVGGLAVTYFYNKPLDPHMELIVP